jgi:hypothetical protein
MSIIDDTDITRITAALGIAAAIRIIDGSGSRQPRRGFNVHR